MPLFARPHYVLRNYPPNPCNEPSDVGVPSLTRLTTKEGLTAFLTAHPEAIIIPGVTVTEPKERNTGKITLPSKVFKDPRLVGKKDGYLLILVPLEKED